MTVHGADMGVVRHTARGRLGHTGCEGTDWESDTAVRCRTGHGVGGTRRAVMTVGAVRGSMSEGWSVDLGGLSMGRRSNGVRTGSGSMTVQGSGMGTKRYTARGRAGGTECEGTDWESETAVRCRTGQGGGGTRRAVMTGGAGGR